MQLLPFMALLTGSVTILRVILFWMAYADYRKEATSRHHRLKVVYDGAWVGIMLACFVTVLVKLSMGS